jgi:hypothetical protein
MRLFLTMAAANGIGRIKEEIEKAEGYLKTVADALDDGANKHLESRA